jgi:hypothetical protein
MENITSAASQLGKLGGKKSAESRFAGKSKEDISEMMRKVRLTPQESEEFDVAVAAMVEDMRKNIT